MKARELLGSAVAPDGAPLTLHYEGEGYVVRIGNEVLMSSRSYGSEQAMAAHGLGAALRSVRPRVLVGGLGMGFTLRAVLDVLPPLAEVIVAELLTCMVEWSRGPLAALSNDALADPRVRLEITNVTHILEKPGDGFDAILLDIDNGPDALVAISNRAIYGTTGLAALAAALRPNGTLTVWSAAPSRPFAKALARAGFRRVEAISVPARQNTSKGGRCTIFVGHSARG